MFKSYFKTATSLFVKEQNVQLYQYNWFGYRHACAACTLYCTCRTSIVMTSSIKMQRSIYRVNSYLVLTGDVHPQGLHHLAAHNLPAMKRDFPEVEQYVRVVPAGTFRIR